MTVPQQNFVACILLRLLLPIAPLIIVFVYDKDISLRAMTLAVSIYVITQGIASKHVATLAVSIVTTFLLTATYGAIDKATSAFPLYEAPALYVLMLVLLMLVIERYIRHVKDCEPFFTFKLN